LNNSLIVTGKNGNVINSLEKELLCIFPEHEHEHNGKDGFTEVRKIEYLEETIDIIKNKHKSLEISIKSYKEAFPPPVQVLSPVKYGKENTILIPDNIGNIKRFIDNFNHYSPMFTKAVIFKDHVQFTMNHDRVFDESMKNELSLMYHYLNLLIDISYYNSIHAYSICSILTHYKHDSVTTICLSLLPIESEAMRLSEIYQELKIVNALVLDTANGLQKETDISTVFEMTHRIN